MIELLADEQLEDLLDDTGVLSEIRAIVTELRVLRRTYARLTNMYNELSGLLPQIKRLGEQEEMLLRELNDYKAAAPLCVSHQPSGGARGSCLVCGLIANAAALSQIDYLCGEPNEYGVSFYDVSCDEDGVVGRVERLREQVDDLRIQVRLRGGEA